jgi:hypothetical protein
MYIQYAGFNLASDSRTYNFNVIDPPEKAREFTVNVQSEAFRSSLFKIQDGPGICLARLKQELDREVQGSLAQTALCIGARDIQEYVVTHYPPKLSKKWGSAGKL